METNNFPNIFVYGLSGSGKDTIANYLRDNCGYIKLRIAGTIKQMILEIAGFKDSKDLEIKKRLNVKVRKAHNVIGNILDSLGILESQQSSSLNRLRLILENGIIESEMISKYSKQPKIICDVRTEEEINYILKHTHPNNPWIGILLTRRNTSEYADTKHKTEQKLDFEQYRENPNIIIIDNINFSKDDLISEVVRILKLNQE